MARQERDRHVLYHGQLSDVPGRNESWIEYVRYFGNNRWELITEGTDFDGQSQADPIRERVSTTALVNWALERDAEMGDSPVEEDDQQAQHVGDVPRELGPRGERLLDIATEVDAQYCVSTLNAWMVGAWPANKTLPAVHISAVTGVTQRGIWIRIYHSVFMVDTNLGPAYLYPPGEDRSARLVLKSESSMAPGRIVKVPKALIARIEELKPALAALRR